MKDDCYKEYLLLVIFKPGFFCLFKCHSYTTNGMIVRAPLDKKRSEYLLKILAVPKRLAYMYLQCRKNSVVYSLLEVIHHWIAFLIHAFLTPAEKDHTRPGKE